MARGSRSNQSNSTAHWGLSGPYVHIQRAHFKPGSVYLGLLMGLGFVGFWPLHLFPLSSLLLHIHFLSFSFPSFACTPVRPVARTRTFTFNPGFRSPRGMAHRLSPCTWFLRHRSHTHTIALSPSHVFVFWSLLRVHVHRRVPFMGVPLICFRCRGCKDAHWTRTNEDASAVFVKSILGLRFTTQYLELHLCVRGAVC